MASTIKFSDLEFLPADQLSLASIAPVVQGGKNYRIALSSINQYDYDHCDDIVQLRNVTSCPGTSAISISADLDLNDHSIINIAANSLKFTNGSKISTTPDGGIEIIPFDGDSLICGGSSGIPLPFVSGGPLSAATNNTDLWNATAEIISNQSDCWQEACDFINSEGGEAVTNINQDFSFIVKALEVITGVYVGSGLSALEVFGQLSGYGTGGGMPFQAIGDIQNPPDPDTGFGQVNEDYRISKHNISWNQIDQYNKDPNNTPITLPQARSIDDPANLEVWEAMRFVNWMNLQEGYPAAYNIPDVPGTSQSIPQTWPLSADTCRAADDDGPPRLAATGSRYRLPSEDEWYKAAYYDPEDTSGNNDKYWSNGNRTDDTYGTGESETWDVNSETTPSGKTLSASYYGLPTINWGVPNILVNEDNSVSVRGSGQIGLPDYKDDRQTVNSDVDISEVTFLEELRPDGGGQLGARIVDKGPSASKYGSCAEKQELKIQDEFSNFIAETKERNLEFEGLKDKVAALESCCITTTSAISTLRVGNEFMQTPFTSNIKIMDAINQQQFDAKQLEGGCDDETMYVIN